MEKKNLVSDSNCNIINSIMFKVFYKEVPTMLGLHLVLGTLHGQFTISIEQLDN